MHQDILFLSNNILHANKMRNCICTLLVILLLLESIQCLNIEMFDVPSHSKFGDSVELSCIYDLKNDRLYSIKWYKNDVEFYRYVPKDWPPGQFLPMPGIRVDLQKSGRNAVYLRHVDLNSAGKYRCEVSAEAPSFNTAEAEKEMKVYVLPHEGPKINGLKSAYRVGEWITANCSSAKSKPAPSLKWYLNRQEVSNEWVSEHSTTLHADGLETSTIGVGFALEQSHFRKGGHVMKLKCVATFAKMHSLSNEVQIFKQRPPPLSNSIGDTNPTRVGQSMSGMPGQPIGELSNSVLDERLPDTSETLSQDNHIVGSNESPMTSSIHLLVWCIMLLNCVIRTASQRL